MKRLTYLPLLLLLTLLLAACGNLFISSPTTGPIDTATAHSQPAITPSMMAIGNFKEYPLPQNNSGLMRPAIDHAGRIWFGEMSRNYLAVFDPHTQFRDYAAAWTFGIMGVEVAPDDTVWFAEQYANYIGHYFPATGQFQTYPLPTLAVADPGNPGKTLTLPSAPNDLALDKHGDVWFTELNAGALGRLDPRSSYIQQYPLSAKRARRPSILMEWLSIRRAWFGLLNPAQTTLGDLTRPRARSAILRHRD